MYFGIDCIVGIDNPHDPIETQIVKSFIKKKTPTVSTG